MPRCRGCSGSASSDELKKVEDVLLCASCRGEVGGGEADDGNVVRFPTSGKKDRNQIVNISVDQHGVEISIRLTWKMIKERIYA